MNQMHNSPYVEYPALVLPSNEKLGCVGKVVNLGDFYVQLAEQEAWQS